MQQLKILILLLAIVASSSVYAQPEEWQRLSDSLMKELPRLREDTARVNVMLLIAAYNGRKDPENALKYASDGLALAQKISWQKGIFNAHNRIGNFYAARADYAKAFDHFTAGLVAAEEMQSKSDITGSYMNLGMVFQNQGNNPKALEYYFKTLKGCEEMGDTLHMVGAINNIGNVYYDLKNYNKALDYFSKALTINRRIGNRSWEAFNLNNIGNVYNDLGDHLKSLEYFQDALKLNSALHDTGTMGINMANIGLANHHLKNYSLALSCDAQALELAGRVGNQQLVGTVMGNMGETYIMIATDTSRGSVKPDSLVRAGKKYVLNSAVKNLKSAISTLAAVGDINNILEFNRSLSDAYFAMGNATEALQWYKQAVVLKDSIFNMENNVKITNLETQRELDLKDKQIEIDKLAVAKKRNERGFFVTGIAGLLLITLLTFRSYNSQKKNNKLLSVEKQKSETLLLNILPSEVATELKEKGNADARLFDNVTVLFTDFVNFTEAGERMSPKQLVDELHNCFKAFDNILDKYGIEKIKTVGDAYLAVSGLPLANPDHAANVVTAAREIRDFMLRRKEQLGSGTFDMRIGIHSGSVVAGIVGVRKFAYDIWGDTVNTAARMEQQSDPGKINISQTTYELVQNKFACEYRGEIVAKNKGMLKMYYVQ